MVLPPNACMPGESLIRLQGLSHTYPHNCDEGDLEVQGRESCSTRRALICNVCRLVKVFKCLVKCLEEGFTFSVEPRHKSERVIGKKAFVVKCVADQLGSCSHAHGLLVAVLVCHIAPLDHFLECGGIGLKASSCDDDLRSSAQASHVSSEAVRFTVLIFVCYFKSRRSLADGMTGSAQQCRSVNDTGTETSP